MKHDASTTALLIGLTVAAGGAQAQAPTTAAPADCGPATTQGWIAPKAMGFTTYGGATDGAAHYLEQYDYRVGILEGTRREGWLLDADMRLVQADGCRDRLRLERDGYGGNNHRTRVQADSAALQLKARYGVYTSASAGIDYLYNPDRVSGGTDPAYIGSSLTGESAHVATFHYDSPGPSAYALTRTTQGLDLVLKPHALQGWGALELSYAGYRREGSQPVNYVLPVSLLAGSNREANQWRGYSKPIDEQNRNLVFNLTFTPQPSWVVNYEFGVDKFENGVAPYTLSKLSQVSGIPIGSGGNPHFVGDPAMPFNYTANSTQLTGSLRLSKQFDRAAALGAGISTARLQQDSFTAVQTAAGYNSGSINTDSAYLNGRINLAATVDLDAFWRYSKRQNQSSYPVTGFYDPVSVQSEERMVAPRLNSLAVQSWGLEARLLPRILRTSLSLGWTRTEKERDLTWGVSPVVPPEMTLYRTQSRADEVFVRLVSRPAKGWTLRVTPSYLWSNQTGQVTEPTEQVKVRSRLSYSRPEWRELLVSGYYHYTDARNGALGFSDYTVTGAGGAGTTGAVQPGVFGAAQMQEAASTFRAAGLNAGWEPVRDLKASLGYDWNQTDFSNYYFSSNRVRYHYLLVPGNNILTSTDILALDRARSKVDTHGLYANLEKQWSRLMLGLGYGVTRAQGQTGSGLAGQSLPAVDDLVDNVLHSLTLGLDYRYSERTSVYGGVILDYYQDYVYTDLTGGRNTVVVGLRYRL